VHPTRYKLKPFPLKIERVTKCKPLVTACMHITGVFHYPDGSSDRGRIEYTDMMPKYVDAQERERFDVTWFIPDTNEIHHETGECEDEV